MVGEAELPDYASPVAVPAKGRLRWTISIPQALPFPLRAEEYADVCHQAEDVARHVANVTHAAETVQSATYYTLDTNYMDVAEAQAAKLLPVQHASKLSIEAPPICEQSLTYVLDATDAGLGSTMLGLWLSYSLAVREERAFFIDDRQFAYGDYGGFFIPPTVPACKPPPDTYRVPCPRQARHLVVSAATQKWVFGESFTEQFETREIFDMARQGYEGLFLLSNSDDSRYVQDRIAGFAKNKEDAGALLVGMHIRHGDRHPFQFQYERSYLQPSIYMSAARDLAQNHTSPTFLVASDDPEVYEYSELPGTTRAQKRIVLGSNKRLDSGSLGWEGGFFANQFWGLGLPQDADEQRLAGSPLPIGKQAELKHFRNAAIPERDYRTNPTPEALQLRELIGRAYLMDLAMLGASDRVVCGVSSYTCRILAVMLGWDRSFEQGHWKNIDGKYAWRALDA